MLPATAFRDDREAAIARAEALDRQLAEMRVELERAREKLETARVKQAALESELAAARGEPAREPPVDPAAERRALIGWGIFLAIAAFVGYTIWWYAR